jgi:hypothetical protein
MPKLTCREKAFLLKDEAAAVKRYTKDGFPDLASQEAEHFTFIKKQPCKRRR